MTTVAKTGQGSTFKLNNGTTLTAIGEVIEVKPPADKVDTVEATHFGSGGRREFIGGLIDSGEGTLVVNWNPGDTTDTLVRAQIGLARGYEFTFPGAGQGQKVAGICIVTGYVPAVPLDDRMTAEISLRFSGAATWTNLP